MRKSRKRPRRRRETAAQRQAAIRQRLERRADRWQWLDQAQRDATIHEALQGLCAYIEARQEIEKYGYGKRSLHSEIPPDDDEDDYEVGRGAPSGPPLGASGWRLDGATEELAALTTQP